MKIKKIYNSKIQIIPDINIDNSKTIGLLENIHCYRNFFKKIRKTEKTIGIESQYMTTYEILISKENVFFYLGFPEQLKDNVTTELNICWRNATFKNIKTRIPVLGETKELELAEHYFLSLKTDLRGQFPLSHLLETQNILREKESVLIRLEMIPVSPTWYREIEEHIKNFNKGRVANKTALDIKEIGIKSVSFLLEIAYTGIDFINDLITDEKIEHEYINNNRYAKLLRNGLSRDTQQKSKYNAYKTKIFITVNSNRADMIFRNVLKSFNSMAGDNSFILKDRSNYKNILCSKELAQIMQMPTRYYQKTYKINNIDNREIEVPKQLLAGNIPIGDAQHKGLIKTTYWPNDKNILALPKIIVGPMGAGKSEYTKIFAVNSAQKGDSVIVFDYIKNCELSGEIAKHTDAIVIDLSKQENLFALAYPEIKVPEDNWGKLRVANMLARQVEYLIDSLSDEQLSPRMSRYLDAASKVTFIHEGAKVADVIDILTNWKIRNEFIRKAKYSGIFKEDDIEIVDLDNLHDRDKDGRIVGTKESKIEGILDRVNILMKDIYLRTMSKAEINYSHNFVDWMDQGKTVLIQLPEHTFTNKQIKDTIVTYFMSRIWLAALQRKNYDKVCHVLIDEIFQVPTASALITGIITEARKFGVDFYFTIHYLKQFRKLHDAIRSAGASYMLLAGTEKENLKNLEEEIKPFTIEEGLNMKPFHSLNIINYGNQYAKFITALPKPL
ncbi:hypothetical protein FQB35_04705 [Crassaminicella thermophila]|uniref:AAA-like domain-containing protein n=1 Tax=Crassaminicella thermophila TaxID=2599308 RepID=A0A5C0SFN2_CRATE|nr:hypothetical protein [Crassaminicella thermophila]QEK11719.1 hypothetical protein FQB35_04705 [Crassaminicella thermophila]